MKQNQFRKFPLGALVAVLLLGLTVAAARYAVTHFRRAGAMSVIEAQAMDMSVMKPPIGAVPVSVYKARRGEVQTTVSYTGSALAWASQEVASRVAGRIIAMPVYPGAKVRAGQLLVRLDSDELRSREAEARTMQTVAAHDRLIAKAGERQTVAIREQAAAEAARGGSEIREAQSGVASAQAMVSEAMREQDAAREGILDAQAAQDSAKRAVASEQAGVAAMQREVDMRSAEIDDSKAMSDDAKSEVEGAAAMVEQAKARLPQAEAELETMRSELTFQREKIKRSAALFKQGAISREELQQDEAAAQTAEAKVRQSVARVDEVKGDISAAQAGSRQAQAKARAAEARIRAAQSNHEAAKARVVSAQAKVEQMQAEVQRAAATVRQRQAEVAALGAKVERTQAEVAVAQAKIAQARQATQGAQAATRGAQAGVEKSREETFHAQLMAQQAGNALTTASVIRDYSEIRAATDGVVTDRLVAPGSLVLPGATILRVAQLDTLRFQANVAQADLGSIGVGTPVTIRSASDTKKRVQTTVSAVFPAADAQSRTGIVEAVADNANGRFKPGEFIVMDIITARGSGGLKIPAAAVILQTDASDDIIATRQTPMVWTMVDSPPAGRTIYTCTMHPQIRRDHPGDCPICHMKLTPLESGGRHRAKLVPVKIGASDGEWTEVLGGLEDGASVIYRGFENLRNGDGVVAEQEAGLTPTSNPSVELPKEDWKRASAPPPTGQTANITVKATGFVPSEITVKAGVPVKLIFTRVEEKGCGTEVVFPDLKIKKTLPLNVPVTVEFTPKKTGPLSFSCGMDMLKGTVMVR